MYGTSGDGSGSSYLGNSCVVILSGRMRELKINKVCQGGEANVFYVI